MYIIPILGGSDVFVLINKTCPGSLLSTEWHGAGCAPWVSLQSGGAGLLHICWERPWVALNLELCGELSGTLPVGFSETDAKDYVNSLYRIEFQCPGTSPWQGLIYTIDLAREKWSAFPKVMQNVLRLNLRRSLERYSSLVHCAPSMSLILCVCLGFSTSGAVTQKAFSCCFLSLFPTWKHRKQNELLGLTAEVHTRTKLGCYIF